MLIYHLFARDSSVSDGNEKNDTERYRSGHNEAVLKTVCPNGHMGSNPILSAKDTSLCCINHIYHIGRYLFGEIPKRPKGLPWKGSRSGEPARGFKSLFLRSAITATQFS